MSQMLVSSARIFFRHFAEDITYIPRQGAPRTIRAVVTREVPAALAEAGRVLAPQISISVRNLAQSKDEDGDGIGGIASSEIDTGGDAVELAERIGAAPRRLQIKSLQTQDDGILMLEVR